MLLKNSLFELIHSLDTHEKRYIIKQGTRLDGGANGYVEMLKCISEMQEYSEIKLKQYFEKLSNSKKLDTKKHYLYYWTLKHLYDYHAKDYPVSAELRNIIILIDRSLYNQAMLLIPLVKKHFIEKESYPYILLLLERELQLAQFNEKVALADVIKELQFYSSLYADLQIYETIKFRFRNVINERVFVRSDKEKLRTDKVFNNPYLQAKLPKGSFLVLAAYNVIHYWYYATNMNWPKALKYALDSYKMLIKTKNAEDNFPEEAIRIIYNLNIASILTENRFYKTGLSHLKLLMQFESNYRLRDEACFSYHLSRLINENVNYRRGINEGILKDAESYILFNRNKFSRHRLNNYYYDLAKAHLYNKNFEKAFKLLRDVIDNLEEKEHSHDFTSFARILFCICCFERKEIQLMISSVRSAMAFMRRHQMNYKMEKRILAFLGKELVSHKSLSQIKKKEVFKKLDNDLSLIVKDKYEKRALNYFDFVGWVKDKTV